MPIENRRTCTAISSATQRWELNAADTLNIVVETTEPQDYAVGDKVFVFNRTYRLNRMPKVAKTGAHRFQYTLEFEGVQYELMAATYDVDVVTTGIQKQDVKGDTLTGNLRRFMDVLVVNANRLTSTSGITWVVGSCEETNEDVTLTFGENDNCLSVLQTLCNKFNCEFDIIEDSGVCTINVVEHVGRVIMDTFKYGRGGGLYELRRENVSSSNIITRLKAYGSTENITSKYRADRLCLPNMTKSDSIIENQTTIAKYGVFEAKKYFDIKPTFTGSVDAVVSGDVLSFIDTSIDFDLNAKDASGETIYLLSGQAAKVHFNSGNLAGYEFDVASYDHTTHKITLVRMTDGRGDKIPSDTTAAFQFGRGDTYKLLSINMPESVIAEAEEKLQTEAENYYIENSQPRVKYALSFEKLYLEKTYGTDVQIFNVFMPGDYIHIVDDDIGVDKMIRTTAIERDLLDEYNYTLTISDIATTQIATRVIQGLTEIDNIVRVNRLNDVARARRNWMTSRELMDMVFDADGDYYSEKIKPLSIETQMLAVGARSQQMVVNCTFKPNLNGVVSSFGWENGTLTHLVIEDTPRTWQIVAGQVGNLTNTALYLYAICSKEDASCVISLSSDKKQVDSNQNYNFLLGVLSSVITENGHSFRVLSLTYGSTTINGRTIQTGIIKSSGSGVSYFDLDNDAIGGKIRFVDSQGTSKNLEDVDDIVQANKTFVETTFPSAMAGVQSQIDGKIETYYTDTDPSASWSTTEERNKHIGDIWYNTANQQGDANRAYRYGTNRQWKLITDDRTLQALADAAAAQDTADNKRRVFVSQPYPPYDVGDLWAQGEYGELLKCITARASGNYVASDWAKACGYTNDSSLNEFINLFYNPKIAEIEAQLDGVIETWFYSGVPTLNNLPARNWSTDADKESHLGDLYYDNASGIGYRFSKETSGNTTTYMWVELSDSAVAEALAAAARAQDTADNKRRVFVSQPYPPYDVGDLWTDGTDLKRCVVARASGNYDASDWGKATNYTGDENLNAFVNGVYARDKNNIWNQIDGKIESWFQTTNPADNWQTTDKPKHVGDIWYNTGDKRLFRYVETTTNVYDWEEIENQDAIQAAIDAANAQDTADGKRRVFTSVPVPPYDPGDLWVQGSQGGILVCVNGKISGSYENTDFAVATKYTGDENLIAFINGTYAQEKQTMQNQIDGKIESWFQDTDPAASWVTTEAKELHVGDLWYQMAKMWLWRYVKEGNDYGWGRIYDKDAIDAATAAAKAKDTADGKRRVFVSTQQNPTPVPPYDPGDLWVDGEDLRTCVNGKTGAETYTINDWDIKVGYDNTQTTIDGGLVTSGTIQVAGDLSNILAGMTGQGNANDSVRFWAGASQENRATAPFRVLQDGSLYGNKCHLEGYIKATSGEFNGTIYANAGQFKGQVYIADGKIQLNTDGSGSLGNGRIWWNAAGTEINVSSLVAGDISAHGRPIDSLWNGYNAAAGSALMSRGIETYLIGQDSDFLIYLPFNPHIGAKYTIANLTWRSHNFQSPDRRVIDKGNGYNPWESLSLGSWETITLVADTSWYVINRY